MSREITLPKQVFIYHQKIKGIDFRQLSRFIKFTFGDIEVKVFPLKTAVVKTKGILLDLLKTYQVFKEISSKNTACKILFTDKLIATEDEFKRLHLRAAVFSEPSIISLSGIVEAVAKPKEYYLYKKQFESLGLGELKKDWLKNKFKGQFIDYGDKRLTEILKGFVSQALFFFIFGEPFCCSRNCRLYNSHWQKDLIFSQVKKGSFCPKHKRILSKLKEGGGYAR